MIDLNESIAALATAREQLLKQVEAVERAISILRGETSVEDVPQLDKQTAAPEFAANSPQSQQAAPSIQGKGRRPGFKLSEEHKRALMEGRRRKRQGESTTAEPIQTPVSAVAAWKADSPPRLVRPEPDPVRELTIVRDDPFAELLEEAAALR
jgi:hypothetical protein